MISPTQPTRPSARRLDDALTKAQRPASDDDKSTVRHEIRAGDQQHSGEAAPTRRFVIDAGSDENSNTQTDTGASLPNVTLAELDATLITIEHSDSDEDAPDEVVVSVIMSEEAIDDVIDQAIDDALTDIRDVASDQTETAEVAALVDALETAQRHVSADDIEAAFHDATLEHASGGLSLRESTVLLLKTGLAFIGLRHSPLDLLIPEHKTINNDSGWRTWRQSDDGLYEIADGKDGWQRLDGTQIDRTPADPATLASSYQDIRNDTYSNVSITRFDEFSLHADGSFSRDIARLTTFDGDLQNPFSITSSFRREATQRGEFSVLEDGMTMEFQHADGSSSRELFYRVADAVVVGTRMLHTHARDTIRSMLIDASTPTGSAHHWLALLAQIEDEMREKEDEENAGKQARTASR